CGLEAPSLHCLDGFLIQTQSQRALHSDFAGLAVRTHYQPQHACPLVLRLARFFRVLRIGLINNLRRRNATAYTERAATRTTAMTRTKSRAGSAPDSATAALTNPSARARSIRPKRPR